MKSIFKLYVFKLVILSLAMTFISFGANAHSLEGTYLCRESAFSPFKTEYEVKNMKKTYMKDDFRSYLAFFELEVYREGIKLDGRSDYHYINSNKNEREFIEFRHNTNYGKWVGKNGIDTQGVKYIYEEKEFSEKSGSKWVTKRSVFCEKQ